MAHEQVPVPGVNSGVNVVYPGPSVPIQSKCVWSLIQSNVLFICFLNEMPLFNLTDTSSLIFLNKSVQVLE